MTSAQRDDLARRYVARLLGSKKPFLKQIAAAVGEKPVRVWDAFPGSGIVAWHLKALGHSVVASDARLASWLKTWAMAVNEAVVLSEPEVDRLCGRPENGKDAFLTRFGSLIGEGNARFFDRVASNLRRLDGEEKRRVAVFGLLWAFESHMQKWVLHPRADRQGFCGNEHIKDKDLEADWRRFMLGGYAEFLVKGGNCESHQGDAVDLAASVKADVAFWDVPYAGTYAGYTKSYEFFEQVCRLCGFKPAAGGGRIHQFATRSQTYHSMMRLFQRSRHIPVWILAFNADCSLHPEEIRLLVECFGRRCEIQRIPTDPKTRREREEGAPDEMFAICRPDKAVAGEALRIEAEIAGISKTPTRMTEAA